MKGHEGLRFVDGPTAHFLFVRSDFGGDVALHLHAAASI